MYNGYLIIPPNCHAIATLRHNNLARGIYNNALTSGTADSFAQKTDFTRS
jgi:hypothetical protein